MNTVCISYTCCIASERGVLLTDRRDWTPCGRLSCRSTVHFLRRWKFWTVMWENKRMWEFRAVWKNTAHVQGIRCSPEAHTLFLEYRLHNAFTKFSDWTKFPGRLNIYLSPGLIAHAPDDCQRKPRHYLTWFIFHWPIDFVLLDIKVYISLQSDVWLPIGWNGCYLAGKIEINLKMRKWKWLKYTHLWYAQLCIFLLKLMC